MGLVYQRTRRGGSAEGKSQACTRQTREQMPIWSEAGTKCTLLCHVCLVVMSEGVAVSSGLAMGHSVSRVSLPTGHFPLPWDGSLHRARGRGVFVHKAFVVHGSNMRCILFSSLPGLPPRTEGTARREWERGGGEGSRCGRGCVCQSRGGQHSWGRGAGTGWVGSRLLVPAASPGPVSWYQISSSAGRAQ